MIVPLEPTSRGMVSMVSKDPSKEPLLDPNYVATRVDRHVWRIALRNLTAVLTGETTLDRDIISDETPPDGFEPLSSGGTSDEELDRRVRTHAR